MLSTGLFETRSTKLIAAVVAVLLLAAFQAALQAKPAHAYEVHLSISGAGTVDEDPTLTQANLLDPACSTASTTPTGTVGKNCYPGDPSGDYGWGWVVKWKATPAPGYTFVRWQSDGSATTSVKCDGASGSDIYTGSACQFATFENLQTRAVFADTTAPSTPSITSLTPTRTNQAVSFNFQQGSSDPTFQRFECKVTPTVQTSFQPCTSGISFNPSDGTYTFEVRAVDLSGNTSSSASRTWTVDKTGPNVTITSPSPGLTNSTSATFTFSSGDPTAQFLCKLDNALFYSSCSSPKTYTGLGDGTHTFTLTAQDSLGNQCCIMSISWKVDLTPPNTILDPNVGPTGGSTTQDNDPVFQFSSSEANSTFECNLTGPGLTSTTFTACNPSPGSSPGTFTKSYTNLPDGTYTFKVRARDQVANVDTDYTDSTRTWTIRNVPTVLTSSLTPLKGATGVSRTTNVSATFSEAMHPTSLRDDFTGVSKTFKLQQWIPTKKIWKNVPATVALSNSDQTATLDPYGATETGERALAARTKFKATITTGAKDAQGTPLAKNFVWTFTTGRS